VKRLILSLLLSCPAWGAYSWVKTIPLDHTKVTATLTNYPMLISGTYAQLKSTGNGGVVTSASGYDIVFTSDAGCTTIIPFDRDYWNGTSGAGSFWVLISFFSNVTDGSIYLCAGNAAVTTEQATPATVWAAFSLVQHYGDGASLSLADSTGNYGLPTNSSVASGQGKISGGASFNGSAYYTRAAVSTVMGVLTAGSVSIWVYPTANGQLAGNSWEYSPFIAKDSTYLNWGIINTNHVRVYYYDTSAHYFDSAAALPLNVWSKVSVDWNSGGSTLYINGASDSTSALTFTNTAVAGLLLEARTGRDIPAGTYYTGYMDEWHWTQALHTGAWEAAEYSNQVDPPGFINDGTLALNGYGTGTLTSSDAVFNLSCGGTCAQSNTYAAGTVLILTSSVTGTMWNGCDSSTLTTCSITISASRTVTATLPASFAGACPWGKAQVDVTAIRAKATVYQNTNVFPIWVNVTLIDSANQYSEAQAFVDSSAFPSTLVAEGGHDFNGPPRSLYFVVPPSYYYKIITPPATDFYLGPGDPSTETIAHWIEWWGSPMPTTQGVVSRGNGTVYQNTSGAPMYVSYSSHTQALYVNSSGYIGATSGTVTTVMVTQSQGLTRWLNIAFIVPKDYYYKTYSDAAIDTPIQTEWTFATTADVSVAAITPGFNTPAHNTSGASMFVSGAWDDGSGAYVLGGYSDSASSPAQVVAEGYYNVGGYSDGMTWLVPSGYYYKTNITSGSGSPASSTIYAATCIAAPSAGGGGYTGIM
jgi:hypothetical protein